jgi:serine/threonine protein kinase
MAADPKLARDALIGCRLGDYLVEMKLGEGAMGAVYRAIDVNLRRHVALKVLRQRLSEDVNYVDRLKREARAVARLNHPNIVHIWSWGTDAGFTYFALEFVEGGTVGSLLHRAGGRLPVRRACEIARQAALGLAAAHAEGVVHRDVKPDNMLLEVPPKSGEGLIGTDPGSGETWLAANEGRVKLADFGIAHDALSAARKITETGIFVGTPRYASPEQCKGVPVDGRSDLYSLGVSLYEILSGTVPHTGGGAVALLTRIGGEPARPIRDANPEVPESVAKIVHRLLEKAPEDRYADALALVQDLDAVIRELPIERIDVKPLPWEPARHAYISSPTRDDPHALDHAAEAKTKNTERLSRSPVPELEPLEAARTATTSGRRLAARLAMIERLAESGHPVAALHAAAVAVREISSGADPSASSALYAVLGKIVAMLRDPSARFRAVPSLLRALEAFRLADIGLAILAGEISDLLAARASHPEERPPARPVHTTAVVHLTELSCGLTLPWKWDVIVGAYDDAVVQLDAEGRQQVLAAATVLMGLVDPTVQTTLRSWNEGRHIVPVVSLRNVGSIQGTSVGLPTLMAMLAARFGLAPREGVAATGALDAATIPTLPGPRAGDSPHHAGFLDVRIRPVDATAVKLQAVLEQSPETRVIVLPRGNERHVEADPALREDLAACGVRVIYVETVRDLLEADLFEPRLLGPPLREPDRASTELPAGGKLAGAIALAQVIAVGAVALLAVAAATFG